MEEGEGLDQDLLHKAITVVEKTMEAGIIEARTTKEEASLIKLLRVAWEQVLAFNSTSKQVEQPQILNWLLRTHHK